VSEQYGQQGPPQDARSAKAQAKADKAYRKASRPFYKKPIFIILALIVVIVIIVIATSGGDDSSSDTSQPAGPSFAGQQEDDSSANAGEAIDLEGVSVTSTPLVDGESFGTGAVLCTTVTIQNGTDDTVNFNGGFDWSMQDPNGASRNTNFAGTGNFLGAGDLVAGGNVTGDVCFDADTTVTGTYVVIYKPTFSFSSDRAAWLNNR
ncbi:Hypothetical protein KLENKIAIHU_65, partial [Klenkia terrae]|jgi:hypothetical protein